MEEIEVNVPAKGSESIALKQPCRIMSFLGAFRPSGAALGGLLWYVCFHSHVQEKSLASIINSQNARPATIA